MNLRLLFIVCAGLLLFPTGCGKKLLAPPPVESSLESIDRGLPEFDHGRRRGAAQIIVRRRGAIDALFRPANWNGDLVLYAHGFTPPSEPIALPTVGSIEPLRDLLLRRGYAVAYSSFSENGYAVKDGMERTDDLRHLFRERLGKARRTYLAAHSLGALSALALVERRSCDYSGALLMAGVLGGGRREIAYISHVRVLFDTFYPGVLPGDLLHLPKGLDLNRDVIGPAVAAIQANPNGAFAISQIVQTPIPFRNPQELVSSIVQALVFHIIELDDLLARTRGGSFFDNSRTAYSGALPPEVLADVNARVARHHMSSRAARYLERYYEPTGDLEIPVLTLHNAFDPSVPVFNETRYRKLVRQEGSSKLLVQRILPEYGHTTFTPELMAAAFDDLVRWVEKGVRPRSASPQGEAIPLPF